MSFPTEPGGPPPPHSGQEAERIPERIGKFRILGLISAGMALVYKAEQDTPRRLVALKIPRGGRLLAEADRRRFLREFELAARLNHPAIVPILEAGETDGLPWYTMPFLEGASLTDHLGKGRPDQAARLALFLRACDALAALHAEGLVHRDLKPENLFVDRHGEIRLLDFGLAKALAEADDGATLDQVLLGTLRFMAPEQTLPDARDRVTPATDVYALGVILYWLLTDGFPYAVNGPRDAALEAIRNAKPEPPSRRKRDLPAAFDAVVLACLRKDPKNRPQTAAALTTALRAAMDGRKPDLPASPSRSAQKRKLIPLVALLLGLLAFGAGLATVLWPKGWPAPRPPVSEPAQTLPETTSPASSETSPRPSALPSNPSPRPPSSVTAQASVPTELWPLWTQALTALREDFDRRGNGALLVRVSPKALPPGGSASVTWWVEGAREVHEEPLDANRAAILFVPAGARCVVECSTPAGVLRRTASAARGDAALISLE